MLFVLAANLLGGRTGRAIVAIRDNHIAAEAMGVNNALYKSLTFGVSAAYTGIAGALSAIMVAFVAPDSFDVFLSITLLTGIVIGGLGTDLRRHLRRPVHPVRAELGPGHLQGRAVGHLRLFLIGFMYVMPRGIAGFLRLVWIRLARRGSS